MLIILLFLCFTSTSCKELPPFVQVCKRTDPDFISCLTNALRAIEPYVVKGIPEMNLPPLDPFSFKNISVNISDSLIHSELALFNGVAKGLSKSSVKDAQFDFQNGHFNISLLFPWIQITAQYKIKGKVLLFDIDGEGDGVFDASNVAANFSQIGKMYKKDGETYFKMEKFKLTMDAESISIYLYNLFKDNDVLTTVVNKAINDKLEALREELDPILEETVTDIYLDNFIEFFDVYSLDSLYPE